VRISVEEAWTVARCVICDRILQAYAKLVEEKGASVEKSGLLKIQREHDENAHTAAAADGRVSIAAKPGAWR
jgi:hypothetical protein